VISEWFINLFTGLLQWFATDVLGTWTPPPELTDAADAATTALALFSSVGVWIPWPVLAFCVTSVLAVWGSVVLVKLALKLWAFAPFVGGSGA
jgi:hypothetical protein